jgi:hypothetical protein
MTNIISNGKSQKSQPQFVMFFTSKLITCFIDRFASGMKSQSIAYLLIGSAHIYWILNLEGEVHSTRICSHVAFKNARAMFFFSKLGGAGINSWSGSKILKRTLGGCPNSYLTPPENSWGGGVG